jgi:hypothetical protein
MARNQTLLKILNGVRAEARLSLSPAHNTQTRDTHIMLIQREQERLWEDFAWPHLRVNRFIPLQAGQRYYDTGAALYEDDTEADLQIPIDRIETIKVKSDGAWLPMETGIGAEHYAAHDSALDDRAWPPRRWKISEDGSQDESIEVWPVPDTDAGDDQYGYLRITGIRSLRAFVEDNDRADLDDRLLELYAAGSILAASGSKDASLKLEAAFKHYGRLKGALTKTTKFNMFGTTQRTFVQRPYISRYRPPVV